MKPHAVPGVQLVVDRAGKMIANICCCRCGAGIAIRVKSAMKAMVDQFMTKRLRGAGWMPGRDRKHDVCPSCVSKKKEQAH